MLVVEQDQALRVHWIHVESRYMLDKSQKRNCYLFKKRVTIAGTVQEML